MTAEIITLQFGRSRPTARLVDQRPVRAKRSVEQWEWNNSRRQERSQAFTRLRVFEEFRLAQFKCAVKTEIAARHGCEFAKRFDVTPDERAIFQEMWRGSLVAALLQPCGYVSETTWKDQKLRRYREIIQDPAEFRAVIAADEAFIKAHPVRGGSHGKGGRPKTLENDPEVLDERPDGFDCKKFAARLRTTRERLGISEEDAARAASVTLQTWQTYERIGRGRITEALLNFTQHYDLSLDDLFA